MARLDIRIFGDPVLRMRAREVTDFDDAVRALADDMLDTLRAAHGVGLAANQVGVLKRVFVWEHAERRGVFVNPEIAEVSEQTETAEEGCLSFPGLFYPAERPLRARLRGVDPHGAPIEETGEGLFARILLHELDHLNGILFIDHLARHDRKEAMRRIRRGELEHPPAPEPEPVPEL